MKWFWIIVLIVVGVFMAVLGFEYLTVGIGHLPAWVPGNAPHKRGAAPQASTSQATVPAGERNPLEARLP